MPASGTVISKNDIVMRHGPYTERGVSLSTREKSVRLEIHECGGERLGDWWNFKNVCTPFWRAYYNFSPGCSVKSGGKLYALDPAQVILVPEGVTFDCIGRPGVVHLWVHFSLHSTASEGNEVKMIPASRPLRDMASMLKTELANDAVEVDRIRHISTSFLHLIFAGMQSRDLTPLSPRLRLICDYIAANLSAQISNPDLASQAGMSVEGFIRWFKKNAGRTPAGYIAEQRIREACRRLVFSDSSIDEVAEVVGFSNRHHFSRVFKRYAGCGPASFRLCKGGPDKLG